MVKEYNVEDVLRRVELRLIELGISKEKFYAESGVSSASYSQWNKGVHEPTSKKIKQMADYLGVTTHYLVTGEGKKEKPATPKDGEPIDWETILEGLSQDELKKVMEIAMKKFMEGKQK